MAPTQQLHNLGQSIWLDYISRDLLDSGTLAAYINDFSVTGLTSNPTIFNQAIKGSSGYDVDIQGKFRNAHWSESLFFDLAVEDIGRAADLFQPIWHRTSGVDGWVSLEVSPLLAHDTASTLAAAKELFARVARPNVFIKIPGTDEGLPAIEEAIFAGIPVNVTLLFSREHYAAAADVYLRAVERRIAARLNPNVASVASVFVSRWDAAVASTAPEHLRNQLGIAVAKRIFGAYRSLFSSERWQRAYNFGARPQRLLWASTGTKDRAVSDTLYVQTLAAPCTVNTMPEFTLKAFADDGQLAEGLSTDVTAAERTLSQFAEGGIDVDKLAAQLQDDGAKAFVNSWNELMNVIDVKAAALSRAS